MFLTGLMLGCDKSEFLDDKPDQKLLVPATLNDFQAILDNDFDMNGIPGGQGLVPHMGETGADNYYLLEANYNSTLSPLFRKYYTWEQDVKTNEDVADWTRPYLCVFNANVVLDGVSQLQRTNINQADYDRVKGSALFYRAHAFYQLAQVFAPPYHSASAVTDLGIPLRLSSDIGEKLSRATVKETYERILADLLEAKDLLLPNVQYKERPSRQAAFALLARTYQTMMEYEKALVYADSCLQLQNTLLDFNTLSTSTAYPFLNSAVKEKEMIFSSTMIGQSGQIPIGIFVAKIDSVLYRSYADNDLRKVVFFRTGSPSGFRFKGSYLGHAHHFAGLAVDEVYLIRAECKARVGDVQSAMDDLNTLLITRYKKDVNKRFVPLVASSAHEALERILEERRKELCFRGLRWTDLRRLNLEGRDIALTRKLDGKEYHLSPNDPKYTYPIPEAVIGFNKTMPQNAR